jgi:glycyl-tRNA synthetase
LGLNAAKMRWRQHEADELSHYSKETWDIEFLFPFGWGELWGIAYRTDFDLNQHQEYSGENLKYRDPHTNEEYTPHCIEPTFGVDRTVLAILINAYEQEQLEDGTERVVMKFAPNLAPVKAAVLPLMKKDGLEELANSLYADLGQNWNIDLDISGSIGKRYRRQDEIGTPFCITVDHQTKDDETVTIRHRDSMKQERVKIDELESYLAQRLK